MAELLNIGGKILTFALNAPGAVINFLWKGLLFLIGLLQKVPWGYVGKGVVLLMAGFVLFRILRLIFRGLGNIRYNISVRHKPKGKKSSFRASTSILPEIKKGITRINKRIRRRPALKKQLSFFLGNDFLREIRKIEKRQKFLNKEITHLCRNRPASPIFVNPGARDLLPGREGTSGSQRIKQEVEKMNRAGRDYQAIINRYTDEEGVLEVRLENIR